MAPSIKTALILASLALVVAVVIVVVTWILVASSIRKQRTPPHRLVDVVSSSGNVSMLLDYKHSNANVVSTVPYNNRVFTTFLLPPRVNDVEVRDHDSGKTAHTYVGGKRTLIDLTDGGSTVRSMLPPMVRVEVTPFIKFDAISRATPNNEIPRIMVQSFNLDEHGRIPVGMAAAMETWKRNNPGFLHGFADDGACRALIAQRFTPRILNAYDTLVPGAFKSDFWRYCFLYEFGGYYADVKSMAVPGWELRRDVDLVLTKDLFHPTNLINGHIGSIYNAFMGVRRHHPLMLRAINMVVRNVERRYYGPRHLAVTGPWALGTAFAREYGVKRVSVGESTLTNSEGDEDAVVMYQQKSGLMSGTRGRPIVDSDKKILFWSEYEMYRNGQRVSSGPHYSLLWKQRKVYRS